MRRMVQEVDAREIMSGFGKLMRRDLSPDGKRGS